MEESIFLGCLPGVQVRDLFYILQMLWPVSLILARILPITCKADPWFIVILIPDLPLHIAPISLLSKVRIGVDNFLTCAASYLPTCFEGFLKNPYPPPLPPAFKIRLPEKTMLKKVIIPNFFDSLFNVIQQKMPDLENIDPSVIVWNEQKPAIIGPFHTGAANIIHIDVCIDDIPKNHIFNLKFEPFLPITHRAFVSIENVCFLGWITIYFWEQNVTAWWIQA